MEVGVVVDGFPGEAQSARQRDGAHVGVHMHTTGRRVEEARPDLPHAAAASEEVHRQSLRALERARQKRIRRDARRPADCHNGRRI